jgi:AraC-like DNA-binding protein
MRSRIIVRSVLDALERIGLDLDRLLDRVGSSREAVASLPEWVPLSFYNAVWHEADAMLPGELVGIQVASVLETQLQIALLGAVEHSATLGDAMIRMVRLGRGMGAGFGTELQVGGETATVRESCAYGAEHHVHAVLCRFSLFGRVGRRLTGQRLIARELRLRHGQPFAVERLRRAFGGEVIFGSEYDGLVIDSSLLNLRALGSDAERCEQHEAEAHAVVVAKPSTPSFVRTVLALLEAGIGSDSIEDLAGHLGLAARTVARKLAAEDTTYLRLRDDLRARRAKEYLRSTDQPATDIGLRLGFSDGTAFTRAFKRWTGLTPTEYREVS